MIKSIGVAVLSLVLMTVSHTRAAAVTNGEAPVVTLGYFGNAPHIWENPRTKEAQGVLVGFLDNVIGPAMGVRFRFVSQPLARVLRSMDEGRLDGAALVGFTKERALIADYPRNSFVYMQSAITVGADNKLMEIGSPKDLEAMKIVYAVGGMVTPFIREGNIPLDRTSGESPLERNLGLLARKRVDAVYWPDANAVMFALGRDDRKQMRVLLLPERQMELFTVFSKHEAHRRLTQAYDEAFERLDGFHRYQRMMHDYLENDTHRVTCQQC